MVKFTRLKAPARAASGLLILAIVLGGCQAGQTGQDGDTIEASGSTTLVERDVEAPEVFQVSEAGLWDGRPSLGGVWVAHPDATDPERVIIRNEANGRFVIGALFRREHENPGPALQVSSDAAAALNMIAGSPTTLNVTALRRQEVAQATPAPATSAPGEVDTIQTQTLDPIAAAAAAIDEAEASAPTASAPAPQASGLDRPYVQIGIFNIEANARRTADTLRSAGLVPTVFEQESNGRPFWRVVVGPARTRSERSALLETIRGLGFSDAYVVTN